MSEKTTKKALLLSLLSMLICIAMLVGTTFAWFTDTATSGSNRIVAGNLSVDLVKAPSYNGDYKVITDGTGDIFAAGENANETTTTLWEPGATHVAYLGVQNTGSLALKYNIYLNVTDGGLADVLEYAIVPFGKTPAEITSWTAAKSAAEKTGAVKAGNFLAAMADALDEVANGTQKETDYFALVVHMSETAGNDYKNKDVTIDVQINATQKDAESDSFDNQYDEQAQYAENCLTFSSDAEFTLGIYEGSNLSLYAEGLESSTDGTEWTAFKKNNDVMPSVTAVKNTADNKYYIYLRGDNMTTLGGNYGGYNIWTQLTITSYTELVDCSGNIMSLLDYDNPDVTMDYGAFYMLFRNCTALRSAPSLPATGLSEWCYYSMFSGCTSLNISTTGDESNKIFTCPSTIPDWAVMSMFGGTANYSEDDGTPEAGYTYYWVKNNACFAAGTKITMADGSLKNIEDITEGDSVLTFNHETCEYEGQKVYIAWHGEYKATAFTLHFDNGNALSIVGEHDLFEKESLKYVTICNSTAEQFIGKHFYSAADGKYVELTGVTYETEAVEFYTIHTEYNKNCIANGMLSVPIETAGSLNIYKFNENLSIDHAQLEADIAEFGLFEYPDDATYSEEFFDAIGGKYINIIVGKGFDTLENICAEIEAFLAGEY